MFLRPVGTFSTTWNFITLLGDIRILDPSLLDHLEFLRKTPRIWERIRGNYKRSKLYFNFLAGKKVGDEDLEEMIESGNPGVFTQGIITDTQQAKQTLADIEARHNDVMRLESSIRELHDM